MVKLVDTVLKVAKAEVGVHEGRSNGHWNNDQKYSNEVPGLAWSDFQPWCCTFVSWVAFKSGAGDLYPRTASCDVAGAWFKAKGRWSEYPAIGAQVFYGTPRDLNHTGIVVAYDDTYIWAVEGNTNSTGSREGDGVYLKKRLRRSTNLVGYGYPAFPGGLKSADPAWVNGVKKTVPKTVAAKPKKGTARVDGIDLSHHNTGITLSALKKAKAAGVRFLIHKATEGTGFTDVQYRTRRRLAAQANIPFGAYHFARPSKSSGTAQAKQFLKVAALKPGDVVPVLDLEDAGELGIARLTEWVGDFVAECERQLGKGGIIYTNFNLQKSFGWKLWVARYSDKMLAPKVPSPWDSWDIWQFSNGVFGKPDTVAGVGHCDINTARISTPLIKGKPAKPVTPPVVVVPPPPVEEPVVVVPPPVEEPVVLAPPVIFRNVQANIQQTDATTTAISDINRIAAMGDVIGWNELGTAALQEAVHALEGFTTFFGPSRPSGAVAISWKTDLFELVDSGSIKVHSGVAHITPERDINWVALRHRASGKVFYRINTHVVHHIESRGKARVTGVLLGQNARAKKHFALLRDQIILLGAKTDPVIIGGDFNVDYLAEKALPPSERTTWFPLTLLSPVAKPVMSDHGTHGGRAIDWTLLAGSVIAVSQSVLPRSSSDHNPVLTIVELP